MWVHTHVWICVHILDFCLTHVEPQDCDRSIAGGHPSVHLFQEYDPGRHFPLYFI